MTSLTQPNPPAQAPSLVSLSRKSKSMLLGAEFPSLHDLLLRELLEQEGINYLVNVSYSAKSAIKALNNNDSVVQENCCITREWLARSWGAPSFSGSGGCVRLSCEVCKSALTPPLLLQLPPTSDSATFSSALRLTGLNATAASAVAANLAETQTLWTPQDFCISEHRVISCTKKLGSLCLSLFLSLPH